MSQTLDQKRAERAYQRVEAVAQGNGGWKKDYGRQCRRLPTLILQTGLCQAVAFLQAKGPGQNGRQEDGKEGLCQAVAFLQAKGRTENGNEGNPGKAFAQVLTDLEWVMELDALTLANRAREQSVEIYRLDTLSALQCAQYLKRYAEAFDLGEAA